MMIDDGTLELVSLDDIEETIDENGRRLAHDMAADGCLFTDPAILKLADKKGWTVAHEMASTGYVFTEDTILDLVTSDGVKVRDLQLSIISLMNKGC